MRKSAGTGIMTIVLAGASIAGCATTEQNAAWRWPTSDGARRDSRSSGGDSAIESNIVRVNKFFSQTPWLSFEGDGSKKVDGVSFTLYLEGPTKPKGVFGTGTIAVSMYRLDIDQFGREHPAHLHEWVMTSEEAYPWRAKQETALGWGYGLRLQWPSDLDVAGRQVAFVIKYIREDGRVISSSRQVLKVPVTGSVPAHLSLKPE